MTKLALEQDEKVTFLICDDGSIKRLKFHDLLSGANEEMGWDDVMGRLDADLLLMTDALRHALTPLKANISSQ